MQHTESSKIAMTDFYQEALQLLSETNVPFMLGGGFALRHYTGIYRDTKDLDIFCKPGEYLHILKFFADRGYRTEHTDIRWLAKVFKDEHFIDIIFDSVNDVCRVDDAWFEHASEGDWNGIPVKYIPAEELVWCKIYVQNRERYDGADVNHIIVKYGDKLDWKRILKHFENHWQLLLGQIINFQFVYPSDRDMIPRWLFDELMTRAKELYELPPPVQRISRGPIIDQTQYAVDVREWNYKVITGTTI